MMRIACAGDNCIDYYDATGEAFPGGNPVNVAVYLRRLGADASYIGAVGDDAYGRLLRTALAEKGVDVSHLRSERGATALSHVSLVEGDRVFGDYEEGVMADFRLTAEELDFIAAHDLLVTGLWSHTEDHLPSLRARGIPVAFDGADRPFATAARKALPHVSVFFFSDDGSDDAVLQDRLRQLAAFGPALTVATRGSRGSMAWDGRRFYSAGIVPCRVVDTMGAGDSFIAGFLLSWLQEQPVDACLTAGARNAAVTIGYRGAW